MRGAFSGVFLPNVLNRITRGRRERKQESAIDREKGTEGERERDRDRERETEKERMRKREKERHRNQDTDGLWVTS